MSDTDELSLAADFPAADRADWEALVDAVLRGRSFDDVLVTTLPGGIAVQPLYTAADGLTARGFPGAAGFVRGRTPSALAATGWDVRQRIPAAGSTADLNRTVLDALQRGARSVELDIDGRNEVDIAGAVDGVVHEVAAVALRTDGDGVADGRMLLDAVASAGQSASRGLAELGCDPVTARLRGDHDADVVDAAALAAEVSPRFGAVRTMVASGVAVAEAGATPAQQIATVLGSGVAALEALIAAGLTPDQAAGQLAVRVALDVDQFSGIALLRALRLGWSRMTEAFGVSAERRAAPVQAELSTSVLTRYDPWVNLLRATVGCFSAAAGGADAIVVPPYDRAGGEPSDLGIRLARNTQLILAEESNLHRVIDPAAGSWYVEALTDALATSAWSDFQDIERHGGIVVAADDGWLAGRVEAAWADRERDIARRKAPIVGVSEFADLADQPVGHASHERGTSLVPRRVAGSFEQLRDAARAAPEAPTVFLANLGPLAVHTARATWATNFFAAGGIEAVSGTGALSTDEVAAELRASGDRLAVICSDDATYAELVGSVAPALAEAGAEHVYLAGHPGEHRERYDAAGVGTYIHVGCDVLATLRDAHRRLGVGGDQR